MSNEFVLITEIFSAILHSKKAASSLIISNSVLYKTSPCSIWTGKLCQHTGYSLQHLSDTVKLLLELIRSKHNTDKATAMREKYVKNSPTDEMKSLLKGNGLALEKHSLLVMHHSANKVSKLLYVINCKLLASH